MSKRTETTNRYDIREKLIYWRKNSSVNFKIKYLSQKWISIVYHYVFQYRRKVNIAFKFLIDPTILWRPEIAAR